MSSWLYLIAETIADARAGDKKPKYRDWKSPLSGEHMGRSLVGLETPYDSLEQRGVRMLLHSIFKRRS